jgi:DNA-binding transcriptional regulator YhcF (GntR family)
MPFTVSISKDRASPVFQQIIDAVLTGLAEERLKPGERLPPERELALTLGVARGTVTRAYAELARMGRIKLVRGSGSIVSSLAESPPSGRKEKALGLIASLIDGLAGMRFGFTEMRAMIDLALTEREERLSGLAVAAVDCNPETLGMFERQIGLLSRVTVRKFLLDEIARDRDPERRLGDFDLVLVTSTHYAELCTIAPSIAPRVLQCAVSPSQETVMRLAVVKPGIGIGLLCESAKFFAIVASRVKQMRIGETLGVLYSPRPPGALSAFLADKDVLILPPGGTAAPSREESNVLHQFTDRGGTTVVFDYLIEKGSLVYVEQRIGSLLSARAADGEAER